MGNNFNKTKYDNEIRMRKLISAALEKFDADELLTMMYEKCCPANEKDSLKNKMIDLVVTEGGVFIPIKRMVDYAKLTEFINSEIYPNYNEQEQIRKLLF